MSRRNVYDEMCEKGIDFCFTISIHFVSCECPLITTNNVFSSLRVLCDSEMNYRSAFQSQSRYDVLFVDRSFFHKYHPIIIIINAIYSRTDTHSISFCIVVFVCICSTLTLQRNVCVNGRGTCCQRYSVRVYVRSQFMYRRLLVRISVGCALPKRNFLHSPLRTHILFSIPVLTGFQMPLHIVCSTRWTI